MSSALRRVSRVVSRSTFSVGTAWRSFSAAPKILIPTSLNPAAKSILEENNFDVVLDSNTPIAELLETHKDAYGLIVRSEKISSDIIAGLPNLKVVVRAGAGFNTIDIKAARKAGVDVMNTPGANANAVAEEVVSMVLSAFRFVVPGDISTRAGKWEKKKFLGRELANKTVGIVGLGAIGQLVVKRMQGFDCKFVAFDPVLSESRASALGVKLTSMEEVFAQSDVITLHMPENEHTKKIINKKYFDLMQEKSVLVNCARQGIINEDDLREAKKNKNFYYCTDVYEKDIAGDKPIADVADLMLPHIGANTIEANTNAAKRAATQIVDWYTAGINQYVVNKGVPDDLEENYQRLAYEATRVASAYHTAAQPEAVATSFYGDLKKHVKWLNPSVARGLGLGKAFDPTYDNDDAMAFLKEKGVTYESRDVDDSKAYGESITVDLFSGKGESYQKVSVRGTVTEGKPMISRINDFEGLYFSPTGHSAMVEYPDRPGVLAKITEIFAKSNVNILDVRAPQDLATGNSLAVLMLDKAACPDSMAEIKEAVSATRAVALSPRN